MEFNKEIISEILVKDFGVVTSEDNYCLGYCYIAHFESRKYEDEIIVIYFVGQDITEQISVKRYKSYIREKNIKIIEKDGVSDSNANR